MIFTNISVEGGWLLKKIPVKKLQEILAQLEPDDLLVPNSVGNLSIDRGDAPDRDYIGFIDISSETLVMFKY